MNIPEVSLKEGKIDEHEVIGLALAPRIGGIPCRRSPSVGVGVMLHYRDAAGPISDSWRLFERGSEVRRSDWVGDRDTDLVKIGCARFQQAQFFARL